MAKKRQQEEERKVQPINESTQLLRKQTIKELIAPSGIDATDIDHLEIISSVKKYARSFFVSTLPRMCTFPELFRDMYFFGDINTSIYINPVQEAKSQNELNRIINELETERIVAADRGNIPDIMRREQIRIVARILLKKDFFIMTTSFYIVLKRNNKNIICASESPSFLIIYNTIISYIKQKSIWKKEFFDKYLWIKSQFQPDFPFAILHGQKNGYSRLFFSMKYTKPIEK